MTPKVLLLLALYAVSILGQEFILEKFILSFNEKINGMVCHYISDHANKSMIYNCHTTLVSNGDESEMHFLEISGFIHEAESEEQEDESEEPDDESDEEEEESSEDESDEEDQEEEYLDAITNDGQIYEDDHSGLYENSTDATV